MDRQLISSGAPWEAIAGYSRAVRVGSAVIVAGTTAADEEGNVIGRGDPFVQATVILEKIAKALQEAGASLEDVVRTRMFVTNIDDWQEVARAHGQVFGAVRPAATLVEVSRLIADDFLVEIEADAIILSEAG
jgi:enamine deaminase RidA (YjgF/YER057c/UK114 family)